MRPKFSTTTLFVLALALCTHAQGQISIPLREINDPGNPPDTRIASDGTKDRGSVPYLYAIAATEITNAQYAAFLNATSEDDPNGLYHPDMSSPPGGIGRQGSPGSYAYWPIAGRESFPVNFVSFWDACRFANWLHNGQPTGPQSAQTTEDGAYSLNPSAIIANSVSRNPSWTWAIASDDEWHKAAYYQPFSMGGPPGNYWTYPTSSDTEPSTSQANYGNYAIRPLLAVASFLPNYSGIYDLAGNVWEWNDSSRIWPSRLIRGGSFVFDATHTLRYDARYGVDPSTQYQNVGLRVVRIVREFCAADFDSSGFVDADDFILFVYAFSRGCTGLGSPLPSCFASADFDASGFIDSDDYILFCQAFITPCE
jgi:sulfatase modifying factor 1